jgi:WD40 repeat protein
MSTIRPLVVAAILLGVAPAQEPKPANAPPTKDQVARWVEQLGHEDFAVREESSAQLAQVIDQAEPALWKVAQSSDAEVARRARDLLKPRWPRTLGNHRGPVRAVTVSADGQRIASAGDDCMIRVWDAAQGDLVSHRGMVPPFHALAFAANGKEILIIIFDGSAVALDASKLIRSERLIHGNNHLASAAAIFADGRRVASASGGVDGKGLIEIWDAGNANSAITLRGQGTLAAMTFSPDGKRLAGCHADRVVVRDTATGVEVFTLKQPGCVALSYRPDGKHLVSAGRSIAVWDADQGSQVRSWEDPAPVTAIVYSPDGKRLVSGHRDGTITIWDADQGVEVLRRKDHTGAILALAVSADGRRIVSGSADGTVKVWTMSAR